VTAKYVYFFRGDSYIRYDARRDVLDPPFARRITDAWNRWPSSFAPGVDAAVNWGDGTAFFFKGPMYLKYDVLANQVAAGDPPYPRKIIENWPGWPSSFASGVDAAVNWGDGTAFFFKGPQYLKYDMAADRVAVVNPPYPLDIAPTQWPALASAGFTTGIGTALEWPYAEIATLAVPANRSGCTPTLASVHETFDMNADLAVAPYPAACFCGEYRQYVRGSFTANGRPVQFLMPDPAGGVRPLLPRPAPGNPRDNFQEDGIPADTALFGVNEFYGHRGASYGNGNSFDQYLPDRAGGCQYRGHDEPSAATVQSGTTVELDADFRGQIIDVANGSQVIATREWNVHCRRTA
jgi:hypothetical protein